MPVAYKLLNGILVVCLHKFDIELQGFLFSLLCSIRHITLWRLLYTQHFAILPSLQKDFLEIGSSILVVKAVDGEDLLAVIVCECKGCLDFIKLILEFALVEKHEHIGIVDDGFLHDRGGGYILYLLGHNTHHCPVLTGGLIEILDILCHRRCGYGFPGFLNNQAFSALLDTHLLGEHVHDDEHDDREEDFVILHLINLEDDELLIKERSIQIVVKNVFLLSTFIERFENRCKIMDIETDVLLFHNLRNTL